MSASSIFPNYYPINLLEILCVLKVSAGQAQPGRRGQVFLPLLAAFAHQPNAQLEEAVGGFFSPPTSLHCHLETCVVAAAAWEQIDSAQMGFSHQHSALCL